MCSIKTNCAARNSGHNSKLVISSDNDFHVYKKKYFNAFCHIKSETQNTNFNSNLSRYNETMLKYIIIEVVRVHNNDNILQR